MSSSPICGCDLSSYQCVTDGLESLVCGWVAGMMMMMCCRATGKVSSIALWGRSMGAATALMHGERDPSIAAMVRTRQAGREGLLEVE